MGDYYGNEFNIRYATVCCSVYSSINSSLHGAAGRRGALNCCALTGSTGAEGSPSRTGSLQERANKIKYNKNKESKQGQKNKNERTKTKNKNRGEKQTNKHIYEQQNDPTKPIW